MPFALIVLGAIIPLLITPGLFFHYDSTPKTVLLGVVAIAMLTGPAMAALWRRRSGRMLAAVALTQVIWFGIASVFSTRPLFSLLGSNWRQFGMLALISLMVVTIGTAARLCENPTAVRKLLRAMACAGIAASVYGICQYFDIDPFQAGAGYHASAGDSVIVRPPGTLGHADYFGWWLAVEFFCGIAVARTDQKHWRHIGGACALATGIAAVMTGTRAALLGIVAGGIVLLLLRGMRFGKKHAGLAVAAVVLFGLFYLSPGGERLRNRVTWSGDEPAGGARPLLWRDGVQMALARPLTGFGPETFLAAFPQFESEQLARLFPDFHYESPHNVLLDAVTQAGIPALLLILGWAAVALRASRASVENRLAPPLIAGLVASGVASLFNGMFLWPMLASLLVLAMLVSLENPDRTTARPAAWHRGAAGIVAVGILAGIAALAISDYKLASFANRPTISGMRGIWPIPGASEDIYASRILAATCPKGLALDRIECQGAASEAAGRAPGTSDDPANAWYNLSMFTAAIEDNRGTAMTLNRAIDASPNWFKPHWILAKALARTGDLAGAAREARRAAFLDAGKDDEVKRTLAELGGAP